MTKDYWEKSTGNGATRLDGVWRNGMRRLWRTEPWSGGHDTLEFLVFYRYCDLHLIFCFLFAFCNVTSLDSMFSCLHFVGEKVFNPRKRAGHLSKEEMAWWWFYGRYRVKFVVKLSQSWSSWARCTMLNGSESWDPTTALQHDLLWANRSLCTVQIALYCL